MSCIERGLTIRETAQFCKMPIETIEKSIEFLIDEKFIKRAGLRFQVLKQSYFVGSRTDFRADRANLKEHIRTIKPITKYIPTQTEKEKVIELLKTGLTRSEIAKKMGMSKSEVLWTISEHIKPVFGEGTSDTMVDMTNLQFRLFQMLAIFQTVDKMYRKLQVTREKVLEELAYLEECGAIMINRKKDQITYLQCDVQIRLLEDKNANKIKKVT